MADQHEEPKIPSYTDIANTRRLLDQVIPGYADVLEGQRRDAEEKRIDAERRQAKHNERVMRQVTFASVAIALIAAVAAIWSGYESHETRVEDERPYLRVQFAGFKPESLSNPGAPDVVVPESHINLLVFGKTPAVGVMISYTCFAGDEMSILDTQLHPNPRRKMSLKVPGTLFPGEPRTEFCDERYTEPHNGAEDIIYMGAVSYSDMEARHHKTSFCYKWISDKQTMEDCNYDNPT